MLPNTLNILAEGSFDFMPFLADIIIVVIMAGFMISCAKKGFITCIFGLISTIVAIIAAVSFASLAVDMTGGLFGLEDSLIASFTQSFSNINGFDVPLEADANLTELLMEQNMAQILVQLINDNFATIPPEHTLGMVVGETLGGYATILIAGVALFIIFKLLLGILKKFFNFLTKGGALGLLNKLLGACIGLIYAILVVSLASVVLSMFPAVMEFLNSSVILKLINDYNPLGWLISLFLLI